MSEEQSLSEKLRAAREQQGRSIEEVRRQTGLSADLLNGLEVGRFDVVEPVFTRMALRSYAEYLGLEPTPLLKQYDRDHPPTARPTPVKIPADGSSARGAASGTASRLPIDVSTLRIVVLAVAALVVFLLILSVFDDRADEPTAPPVRRTAPPPPPARPADREEPAAESASSSAAAGLDLTPAEDAPAAGTPTAAANRIAREVTSLEDSFQETMVQTAVEVPAEEGESPSLEDSLQQATAQTAVEVPAEEGESPSLEDSLQETMAQTAVEVPAEEGESPSLEDTSAEPTPPSAEIPEREEELAEDSPPADSGAASLVAADSAPPAPPPVAETAFVPTPVTGDSLLQLEVEAIDSTWVQIRWDGSGLFEGTVLRGERRLWRARKFFLVRAGRAHGLRYWFQGQLLGDGRLGDSISVLRFRAEAEGVTLLGPDLQPLNAQPNTADQP